MKRKLLGSVAVVLALLSGLLMLAGCSGGKSVKVAVAVPLTGEYAKGGKEIINGCQLAVDEWNSKGGVLGKNIELIQGDDEGKKEAAAKLAQKLVDEGVVAVIGHYLSDPTLSASEVYNKAHRLMITPSATTPEVTDRGYLTIFRICGRDDQQGAMAAEYASKHFGDSKVAILHDKTAYGQDLANEFLKNWEFLTGQKSAFYSAVDPSQPDFPGVIQKIKENSANLVYFGGSYPLGGPLLKALREGGITATFISGDGNYDPMFLNKAGFENAEGAYVSFRPDAEKQPKAKEVMDAYRKRFGEPGPYSLYAYVATEVALKAIADTKSTDGIEVARKLHSMTADTAIGPIKFDDKGDPQATPFVMWTVKDGKFVEAAQ